MFLCSRDLERTLLLDCWGAISHYILNQDISKDIFQSEVLSRRHFPCGIALVGELGASRDAFLGDSGVPAF